MPQPLSGIQSMEPSQSQSRGKKKRETNKKNLLPKKTKQNKMTVPEYLMMFPSEITFLDFTVCSHCLVRVIDD